MRNDHKDIILTIGLLELSDSLNDFGNVVAEGRNEEWVIHAPTPRLLQFIESPAGTEWSISMGLAWVRTNGPRDGQILGRPE